MLPSRQVEPFTVLIGLEAPENSRGGPSMTQLPHALKRIRLNLARSKEFPQGSARHGYEFVAPLRPDGRLVHKSGGAEHARWIFDYDETAEDDDEAGYRFGDHAFHNGEYVSIRDED